MDKDGEILPDILLSSITKEGIVKTINKQKYCAYQAIGRALRSGKNIGAQIQSQVQNAIIDQRCCQIGNQVINCAQPFPFCEPGFLHVPARSLLGFPGLPAPNGIVKSNATQDKTE